MNCLQSLQTSFQLPVDEQPIWVRSSGEWSLIHVEQLLTVINAHDICFYDMGAVKILHWTSIDILNLIGMCSSLHREIYKLHELIYFIKPFLRIYIQTKKK